jgi:hypothetical protein
MCTPSPPPAPDYKLAAQQTAAGNQNASIAAQYGNMTNQVGPQQFTYDAETGAYSPTGTSTGVTYINPAKPDSQGSMPFDMSSLTQAQRDAYNAGKGLPKNFVKTYDPQQWSETQTLGANDQQLFNQSQATQLGLSKMALTGLDKVKQAISQGVAPEIAIQGGPESTADRMTTNVNAPDFVGGGLDTSGLQGSVGNAGQMRTSIGPVNGVEQYVVDNNGDRILTQSGANQQASGLGAGLNNSAKIQTNLGLDPTLLNQQAVDAYTKRIRSILTHSLRKAKQRWKANWLTKALRAVVKRITTQCLTLTIKSNKRTRTLEIKRLGKARRRRKGCLAWGFKALNLAIQH